MSIAKLLEAQKVDQARLALILSLEKGSVKVELDKANRTIADSKQTLLQLEADAKTLQESYQKIAKVIKDILHQVEHAKQSNSEDMGEYGNYLSKLSVLEGQLADMERRITEKSAAFKNTTMSVMKASEFVKKTTQLYETQKQTISQKTVALEQEFNTKVQGIDEKLLNKYKAIRKSKGTDTKDVVVPLTTDNRCQGCYMDVPAVITSRISTDGWAICEECGRIIYKNENVK